MEDYKLLGDDTLVRLLKASDEKAFREIFERYWKTLFLTAVKKIRSEEIAEELVQDILVSLWQKRLERQIDNLSAYLHTAVKYAVINFIKASLVRDQHSQSLRQVVPSSISDSEYNLLLHELNLAITHALAQLPEKTQQIFRLSRFEHRSVKEIAATMELSEKSVEYHITQSLKMMRLHLKDYILFALAALLFSL